MPIRLTARLLLLSMALSAGASAVHAQNLRFPGRGSKKPADQDVETMKGVLRVMKASEMTIETDDKRFIKILRDSNTKFLEREEPVKPEEIQIGDRVMVDVSEDKQGRYNAVEVRRTKHGTPEERARARAPIPGSDSDDAPPPEKSPSGSKQASSAAPAATEPQERPATEMAPAAPKEIAPEDRPKLTRGRPSPRKVGANGETEPDEPVVAPEARTSSGAAAASGRNPSDSDDPRDIRREADAPPSAESTARDRFIDKARDVAENFVETLPNYTVKQFTTRFESDNPRVNWRPLDNVSAEVVYEGGKESYKNILVNGKPPKGKIEESGAWSTGEFGSVLRDLFSPYTAADFIPAGNATIVNHPAKVYKFTVEQENSHWKISSQSQSYMPAFKGTVWIDKESFRVLRIEMQTQKMPKTFPYDTVESTLDYDFIRLGTANQFLLPVHSENLICVRDTSTCSKNVIDFRNYRKFGAEATIIFK